MPTRRALAALLALPALAGSAWAQPMEPARAALRAAVSRHVLPRHAAFTAAAAAFASATAALRTAPEAARADAARAVWAALALAFQGIRHLRFGPMEAFDHGFRITLFPDPRNATTRELAELLREGDPESITPQAFARGRVAAQGLPAAERLLFGEAAPRLLAPDEAFRRRLLAAIGANLLAIAQAMQQEWAPQGGAFGTELEGTPGGVFRSPQDGLLVLFKSLHGGLEFLGERQVARALGATARQAFPRRTEAWRSGASLALVQAGLAAQAELWRTGFAPLVAAQDAPLAAQVAQGYAAAEAAAAAIAPSLEKAVVQPAGRAAVEALLLASGQARRLLTERVAPAIGLPVGFNSMDGD
ncbi:imelysin family protein [Falsiroseomonas selenitidurans]|uniref:Imelysin family protein n=1 Tax=Falsiroseomonas selenitidurans TaxID=2716335 RepID=A0ABX1E239_9PROT|nr:imelysin family protein [Falsiroseomonas selenitidurans]NKC31231.1 imelysin family protein [Falsiroseomonas selenitidurans]